VCIDDGHYALADYREIEELYDYVEENQMEPIKIEQGLHIDSLEDLFVSDDNYASFWTFIDSYSHIKKRLRRVNYDRVDLKYDDEVDIKPNKK